MSVTAPKTNAVRYVHDPYSFEGWTQVTSPALSPITPVVLSSRRGSNASVVSCDSVGPGESEPLCCAKTIDSTLAKPTYRLPKPTNATNAAFPINLPMPVYIPIPIPVPVPCALRWFGGGSSNLGLIGAGPQPQAIALPIQPTSSVNLKVADFGRKSQPLLDVMKQNSSCTHFSEWKRLRIKKGVHHMLCRECGTKWKCPADLP